jgi:hypothetical protein
MYSTYVVESATVSCLELFQLTAPPLRQNIKLDYDLESSASVWNVASLQPFTMSSSSLQTQGTLSWFFSSTLGCSL